METETNPLEAVRAMMVDTLEKSRDAMQSYIDLLDKTMRGLPNANEAQVGAFRAYVERQVAANHAFVDKLLRAKDFQDALRIQSEYFQSQFKAAADGATQFGANMTGPFKRSAG